MAACALDPRWLRRWLPNRTFLAAGVFGVTAGLLDVDGDRYYGALRTVMVVFVVIGGIVGSRFGRPASEKRQGSGGRRIALWAVAGVLLIAAGVALALYAYYWMNMEYDPALQSYRPDRSHEEGRIPFIATGGAMIFAGLLALLIASVAIGTRIGSQSK